MDVNGTRFHGLLDAAAWRSCSVVDGAVEWQEAAAALTLRRLPQPPQGGARPTRLPPEARRGAGTDGRGNWYWISADRGAVIWQPAGGGAPARFWPVAPAACPPAEASGFEPVATPAAPRPRFAGLAVTLLHRLVLGEAGALHVFDLEAGGPPTTLRFAAPFEPFDIAPLPDGGVAVLDRAHRRLWRLDRHFALLPDAADASPPPEPPDFHAADGSPAPRARRSPATPGIAIGLADPIAVEALPDGRLLLLGRVAGGGSQLLLLAAARPPAGPLDLPPLPDGSDLAAHDIAAVPDAAGHPVLHALQDDGGQAFALRLDAEASPSALVLLPDHFPLHQGGGRGLVGGAGGPFYDVSVGGEDPRTRWLRLAARDQPRFAAAAALESPVFETAARGTTWHRVFVDACLPPGTTLRVLARAHDEREMLDALPWQVQPAPYRRALGPEIPFLPRPDGEEATFETLLQELRGRHAQLRLEIAGNGRVSPRLRRLRLYAPRFSYVGRYLPAAYREDAVSASFLERLLANPEGLLAQIEGSIADVRALLDPVAAPAEALDWLASWLGLVLDPIWSAGDAGTEDRRRLLIRCAPLLFERRGTPDGLRFALLLYLDPCLARLMQRIDRAAAEEDPVLRQALGALRLPYPARGAGRLARQALFFAYVAASARPSSVRIVEHFTARGGRGVAAGLPAGAAAALEDSAEALAHRFTVLLPDGLAPDDAAMVERIVELEKPAHTDFALRRYVDAMRVGEARVGLDSVVGLGARFTTLTLGVTPLAAGFLGAAHPLDIRTRPVAGRDRIGGLPPL